MFQKDKLNLPELEEKVLNFWETNNIFQKSLNLRKNKKRFRFFEGPPYANGKPGIHHLLARAFKDIILRYKSMCGFYVERRAGWDTQGLPTEIEAEKSLNLTSKSEIEQIGIDRFVEECRKNVFTYKKEWEQFTKRIGFWIDLENAYITCDNKYLESLWWILDKIYKKGLLKKSYRVLPYCPRCGTPLSYHELGMPGVYRKVSDPSIYIKFKLKNKKLKTRTYLLVWTTTPWTLPANVAIAVNPKLIYKKYKLGEEILISYNPLPLPAKLVGEISGKELEGLKYNPLYPQKDIPQKAYQVWIADFVSKEEGTGLVHIAPAFGEEDFDLFKKKVKDQKFPITVDDRGKMKEGVIGQGLFIKDADKLIIEDLKRRQLLLKQETIVHDYPFCWRCNTPLIYLIRESYFILMTKLKDKLLSANRKINWIPGYLKYGRFGKWLKEVRDWTISRERYWGTPLPLFKCLKCGKVKSVKSLTELTKNSFYKNNFYILRHGQAESNLKDVVIAKETTKKCHLTQVGIKEIKKILPEIKKINPEIIYCSPLTRAVETAKIIADYLGIEKINIDKRLTEINFGEFEGKTADEYRRFFRSKIEKFYKAPEGGETLQQVARRMFDLIKEINRKYRNKTILIVSHQDPLFALEVKARNLTPEQCHKAELLKTGQFKKLPYRDLPYNSEGEIDIHRPYVDGVYLECSCGGKMVRVKDVVDVWFDSGAMPWAQWHWPFENQSKISENIAYPADFICEGIDQTRGWFYNLLAVGVLLGMGNPYRNVMSLGLVLDKYGQKMSKSKGNVVEPFSLINKYGVDVLRWYFYTINSCGEPKRFDEQDLPKVFRKFFLLLYNCFRFYQLASVQPQECLNKTKLKQRKILENWMLSRLNQTIKNVRSYLNKYNPKKAAEEIQRLVEDLSHWYIRLSRENISLEFLKYVLKQISLLSAPFVPFFSEALYLQLKNKTDPGSVHLNNFPRVKLKLIDKDLLKNMETIRGLTSEILAQRKEAKIKLRQPLSRVCIPEKYRQVLKTDLAKLLKNEANVKKIVISRESKLKLDTKITPELKEEGILREITRLIQDLRKRAGLQKLDKIILSIDTQFPLRRILQRNENYLKQKVNASLIEFRKSEKFQTETETRIENKLVWIGIRKV